MKQSGKKRKRLINIRRWDSAEKRTHGWFVQVERLHVKYVEFFSDNTFGGKRRALAEAIQFRDAIKQGKLSRYKRWRQSILRKNNTSGTPGVGRYVRMNKAGTIEQPYWQASWTDAKGIPRSRKFLVSRYGEKEAERLAKKERRAGQQRCISFT